MRITTLVAEWGGLNVLDAMGVIHQAWSEAGVEAAVIRVPDGGPSSALSWQAAPRPVTPAVGSVEHGGQLWLFPSSGTWDPGELAEALDVLASSAERSPRIVIPVGDKAPSGHPTALWRDDAAATARAWAGLDMAVLVGADRPLLGFQGMSAAMRDGKDADLDVAAAAQAAEDAWTAVAATGDSVSVRVSLLGAARTSDLPGSGAAGGLAYCLAVAGARLLPAARAMDDAVNIAADTAGDLVVAVCSVLSPAALDRGVAAGAAAIAARSGVPAVTLSTEVHAGRRDLMTAGIASAHEAEPGAQGLADGVRRVAQTWRMS